MRTLALLGLLWAVAACSNSAQGSSDNTASTTSSAPSPLLPSESTSASVASAPAGSPATDAPSVSGSLPSVTPQSSVPSSRGGSAASATAPASSSAGAGASSAGASSASGGVGQGGSPGVAGTGAVASLGGSSADAGVPIEVDDSPRPTVTAASDTDLVTVDVQQPHQSFEGWGTSLCWWANHVGGWDAAARDAVVDAVVDPVAGLGYNIFRYNIGGGDDPSHDHMGQYRDIPGFESADGTWNWDADANQRAVLLGIVERGSDLILEAFSNSPPYFMTKSGCASGSDDGSSNLKDDSYDAFADYLTEVVGHYRDEYGIVFRTLEPLNEPNANWWQSNGSQEGCHFSPADQERIIQAVAAQLQAKGLSDTEVSASDENSMDDAVRNIGAFSDATTQVMSQINVHSYAGTRRTELRQLATRLGKRLWQSESGPLSEDLADDTDAALFMAGRIITDLRDLGAEAWVDWQAGDPSRNWASFTLDDRQQSYSPLKRFYMHAGFSRYIRPGAVFVDIDDANMVAATSADERTLTIVVRNGDPSASHGYTFDVTSLPSVGAAVEGYRTSRSEDLVPLDPIGIEGYSFVVTVPPASVTTFVVPIR